MHLALGISAFPHCSLKYPSSPNFFALTTTGEHIPIEEDALIARQHPMRALTLPTAFISTN